MATKKISELTELTSPAGTEELIVNAGGTSKKVQIDNLPTPTLSSLGVTATTAELNYVDGVTSNIQTQLGTKLPLTGGTMTGTIAGFTSTGIDDNATSTAITIDASENVGIGTSSPVTLVEAWADTPEITITSNNPLSTSVGSENISSIGFRGQYNNLYRTSARIQARQNGTWSTVTSNIAPTAIDFFTQTSGTGDGMPTPKVSILADGGITFNGDTAAANALDDYEEGTWTPTVSYQTPGTVSTTYSLQSGTYTKIGNLVTVAFDARLTAFTKGTASGYVIIDNLPFTPSGVSHKSILYCYNAPFTRTPTISAHANGYLLCEMPLSNGVAASLNDPDANSYYFGSVTYKTA